MGRPGHPVLNWNQLRKAQAVYFFFGSTWKKAMVTEIYPTSCTIIYKENERDYAKRVADLENIRSVLGYDSFGNDTSEKDSSESKSGDDQSHDH